jgi:F0F1-type ATP synthase assembly protein I
VNVSQGRELTQDIHRSSGSFELVLGPLLMALVGFGLDRWIGLTPLLTVTFAMAGLVGACVNLYYGYRRQMAELEVGKPWARDRVELTEDQP